MATLERPHADDTAHGLQASTTSDPSQSAVPTPFPAFDSSTAPRTDSRSPRRQSLSRTAGGFMDKVKRVVSASRDRASSQRGASSTRFASSADRNRSRERGTNTEDTRGRSGQQEHGGATMPRLHHTHSDMDGSTLHQTTSRSTSRGRPLKSVGRGGAGNMLDVDESLELTGDEPEDVVRRAREEVERERSMSRERTGREEFVASGRGGQGNIRSRSRGRELDLGRVPTVQEQQEREQIEAEEQREQQILEKHAQKAATQTRWFTSGRGGAGNVRSSGPPPL
ncbi:hypothetical protein OIV83_006340 [Microbotryomycetes sp. JL201]|nr:hypothetical protein OIV83_006340 [Microbotryomycetes sp. JL201]